MAMLDCFYDYMKAEPIVIYVVHANQLNRHVRLHALLLLQLGYMRQFMKLQDIMEENN
jgi:hypothetical protein